MAHEGAHATVHSATGRRVVRVTLSSNGEGATFSTGSGRGILGGVAGYLGPSAFGLAAAELIRVGHAVALLWAAIAALAGWACWPAGVPSASRRCSAPAC